MFSFSIVDYSFFLYPTEIDPETRELYVIKNKKELFSGHGVFVCGHYSSDTAIWMLDICIKYYYTGKPTNC